MQSVQFRLQCLSFRFVASCTSTSRFPIFPEAALRYPILCWRCVGHFSLDGIIMSHPHHIHIISSYSLCGARHELAQGWASRSPQESRHPHDTSICVALFRPNKTAPWRTCGRSITGRINMTLFCDAHPKAAKSIIFSLSYLPLR